VRSSSEESGGKIESPSVDFCITRLFVSKYHPMMRTDAIEIDEVSGIRKLAGSESSDDVTTRCFLLPAPRDCRQPYYRESPHNISLEILEYHQGALDP
jgi:hypothetical protein